MIRFEHLSKTFQTKDGAFEALKDVSFEIEKGDIYGVIGYSGAGKSTLIRMVNALERPTSGKIFVEDKDIGSLSAKELRSLRKGIGMIFQQFNLLESKTIYDNVAIALKLNGTPKKDIETRVNELLEFVELSDKKSYYPGQLSGGQKQRVGIARALANNPSILLCDEATSALDPQTTASILSLLKEINEKLGITIVIITHQMSVIREICSHVAIIEHGVLVEDGLVEDIFSHPKSKAAKELILRDQPGNNNAPLANAVQERMQGDKKIRIVFSENSAFEPVIANMILQFKTPVNILRADTKNVGGVAKGEMILGLPEDRHLQVDIEEYLKEKGLAVEEVTEDVE